MSRSSSFPSVGVLGDCGDRPRCDRPRGGGPLGETATWSYEVFTSAFRSVDLSPSSVISVVVLLVNLLLGYLYTRFTGRVTG